MRTRSLLVAAALGLAATAPPASGGAASTADGSCSYLTVPTDDGHQGYYYLRFVLSSTVPGDDPVSATVTCTLYDVAEPAATITASGTGVVAAAVPVTLSPGFDHRGIATCYTVDFTSDDTPTREYCVFQHSVPVTDAVPGLLDYALTQVPGGKDAFCDALAAVVPVGDVVHDDGSVDVGDVHGDCEE